MRAVPAQPAPGSVGSWSLALHILTLRPHPTSEVLLRRPASVEAFNATFGPFGFSPTAMIPSYGLAEHVVGCPPAVRLFGGLGMARCCGELCSPGTWSLSFADSSA